MFERLNRLVDVLDYIGKSYTSYDLVRKVLRTLPKLREAKKMDIKEANHLFILPLDQLMSSLKSYEIERSSQPNMKSDSIAFKDDRRSI